MEHSCTDRASARLECRAEQAEPELAEPELAKSEQAEPEQAEPEQAEPEQAEPEQAKAEFTQDAVGLGAADAVASADGAGELDKDACPLRAAVCTTNQPAEPARSTRRSAAAASERIQRVLAWEGCKENSAMFRAVASRLEKEFGAEDLRRRRRREGRTDANAAGEARVSEERQQLPDSTQGVGQQDSAEAVDAEQEDSFEPCSDTSQTESSEEESEDGSYESSFVVSDGEGETTEEHTSEDESADDDMHCSETDPDAEFVITVKRRRV